MNSGLKILVASFSGFALIVSGFFGYLKYSGSHPAPASHTVARKAPAEPAIPIAEEPAKMDTVIQEPEKAPLSLKKDLSDKGPTDFVDIQDFDKDLVVRPIFLEMPLLTGKDEAAAYCIVQTYEKTVLRKATAEKLKAANALAIEKYGCRIRVYEGYRAIEVQKALREHFVNTAPAELQAKASTYIASPGHSKHQSGVAVDLTLVDMETGKELKMPSDYLSFSLDASAYPDAATCDETAMANVRKLQDVMVSSGFEIYSGEWWHFNDMETLKEAKCEVISPDDY